MVFLLAAVLIAACGKDEGPWSVKLHLSPETAQVRPGESRTFTAGLIGHKEGGVTWSVAEPAGGTITDRGVYTAPTTAGTFHVVATSVAFPAERRSAAVTVAFPSGTLDPAFGAGGKAAIPIGPTGGSAQASALAIQPDGKVIAAGSITTDSAADFAVIRLNADGTLDTTFDAGGSATLDFSANQDSAFALAVQPDGMILVAGLTKNGSNADFALARLKADGTPDLTFGAAGKVTTDFGANEFINAIALQSDGKIVAAGASGAGSPGLGPFRPTLPSGHFRLARYNSDGSIDSTFGTGGTVTTPVSGSNDAAHTVALQFDGKIVAAGFSFNGTNNDFALVRYNPDGSLDSAFGTAGQVITPIGIGEDQILSLTIQADGKILAAGVASNGLNNDFALVRYNSNGTLDAAFGTGGKVTTDFSGTDDAGGSLTIQSDGRIVMAGSSKGTNDNFALARYHSDGTLDSTFGTGGKVTTDIGIGDDVATSVAIQPQEGKIVAAGRSFTSAGTVFSLARYWP